ncbi:Endoplasmic reticulum oxidoreductin-1 [Babesia sp. Xinjiang]|uniref:Endoplasmic reticulum oxidoreductin-1 n=1 Tax=Babesia sp. Xinjiang TaxID=462227 RepID=UPI000A22F052|nr:Endoplasmic reticulum oxidoreductin-1 [Babesia sp. Xinjiang]ORM41325.1 Endoplasmic reticulum oxidoreductin-1 [Babesia sp. Xinjiang]
MKAHLFVLAIGLWAVSQPLVGSIGPMDGVKTDAITRIVVPAHAEGLLGVNVSPMKQSSKYVNFHGDQAFRFEELLSDAEIVHSKLVPIMRELYFRIFRVNLDSPCTLRERNDTCSYGNDGEHVFEGGATDSSGNSECIPKCYVGRCQPHEVTSEPMLDGLEHFVLRYSNDEKLVDMDPKDLYSNNPWYKDILGMYSKNAGKAVYVDLMHNPPSHTGYRGGEDWNVIYDLECDCGDEVPCEQTEHLFRLISGMQSSVAAWAAWNYKCVNPVAAYQTKTELPRYTSNPDLYFKMLGNHPERLENLYYAFQTMLKTVCRLSPFLKGFAKNLGQQEGREHLQRSLFDLLSVEYDLCRDVEPAYDVRSSEVCEPAQGCVPSAQLKHPALLNKFHDLSDIVDCVGCEKCRLHGKLKLTALQIAVRASGQAERIVLERNEIVALLHALDYFAESIIFVHKFDELKKRQLVLYPLRVIVTLLVMLVVTYRRELRQALCQCHAARKDPEAADNAE